MNSVNPTLAKLQRSLARITQASYDCPMEASMDLHKAGAFEAKDPSQKVKIEMAHCQPAKNGKRSKVSRASLFTLRKLNSSETCGNDSTQYSIKDCSADSSIRELRDSEQTPFVSLVGKKRTHEHNESQRTPSFDEPSLSLDSSVCSTPLSKESKQFKLVKNLSTTN